MEEDAFIEAGSVAVISDVHVGSGDCVLDDGDGGYQALRLFLHDNDVKVDTFILLGDIFDLALARYDETVKSARKLFALLPEFCHRIIYVPGNHDHHLAQLVSDEAEIVARFPNVPRSIPRVERRYTSTFLSRMDIGVPIEVCYPNVYWRPPSQDDGVYIFHHGHFCQPTYRALSEIYRAAFGEISGLQALETINSGWLELVWYSLGQASAGFGANGVLEQLNHELEGANLTAIEDALQRLYERRGRALVDTICESIRQKGAFRGWLARFVAKRIHRNAPQVIADAIQEHLRGDRVTGGSRLRGEPLDGELKRWCWEYLRYVTASRPDLQGRPVSFVFGHTHRPGVWPEDEPHLFNDGAWARAANDDWAMPAVLVIDDRGRLTMLEYGPHGRRYGRREYPFSPLMRAPPAVLEAPGSHAAPF